LSTFCSTKVDVSVFELMNCNMIVLDEQSVDYFNNLAD